jgi:hypothetical protein
VRENRNRDASQRRKFAIADIPGMMIMARFKGEQQ